MNSYGSKQVAIDGSLVRNRTIPNELLIATDDSPLYAANIDAIRLISRIVEKGNRPVRVVHLPKRLSVGWMRYVWTRMADAGAVHIHLSQISLATPSVLALLIVAKFFGRTASAVIAGPAADLDGDSLRRQSFVLRLISRLAVQSPFLYEQLRRHSVNCSLLPAVLQDRWYIDRIVHKVQPLLLWAGDGEEHSQLDVAVRAYQTVKQKYPRAELIIAIPGGEGKVGAPMSLSGIQLVDSSHLNQLDMAYKSADLFINTSIVDSQPVAVLRAMAAGLPVLSTSVGSLRRLIEHGKSGLLLPIDSPGRFSDSIIDLVETEGLAERLSTNGRKSAEAFRHTYGKRVWRQFFEVPA